MKRFTRHAAATLLLLLLIFPTLFAGPGTIGCLALLTFLTMLGTPTLDINGEFIRATPAPPLPGTS